LAFFERRGYIRAVNDQGCVHRFYRWLSRASLFRSESSSDGMVRTSRTEVTFEQQETTLLVSGGTTELNICPFCGQKLIPRAATRGIEHDGKSK
jgi:hypothetical protein